MKNRVILKFKKALIKIGIHITLITTSVHFAGKVNDLFRITNIKLYNQIIDDFSDLLEENNINSPIDVFDYYSYALWNGYLSNNKYFEYNTSRNLVFDYYGIECINGKAVCLNQADMLTDIYNSLGYKAFTINCYVDTNKEYKLDFIRTNANTKRNITVEDNLLNSFVKIISPITKITGNHAITCVKYNDEYLFFDPTQIAYLEKDGLFNVAIINGQGEFKLKYLTSIIYNDNINLKSIFCKNDSNYSDEVLNGNIVLINEQILENFYDKHKDDYNTIATNSNKIFSYVTFMASILIAEIIIKSTIELMNSLKHKDYMMVYKEYIVSINNFLDNNNLKELYNRPIALYKMLENGYLPYEKNIYNAEATFIKDVLKDNFDVTIAKIMRNNCTDNHFIIIFKVINDYYFYDCQYNAFLIKKQNREIFNGIEEYELYYIYSNDEIKDYISDEYAVSILNSKLTSPTEEIMKRYQEENKDKIKSFEKKLNKL